MTSSLPHPPISLPPLADLLQHPEPVVLDRQGNEVHGKHPVLMLNDGTVCEGISFGAEKSVAGECVFQTGKYTAIPSQIRHGGLSRIPH
jgi:hypothetical protein